jgi:hypothetical protein
VMFVADNFVVGEGVNKTGSLRVADLQAAGLHETSLLVTVT